MAVLLELAPWGATDEQLHGLVGGRFSSVKDARLKLVRAGLVQASTGSRQLTSWRRFATAWRASKVARELAAGHGRDRMDARHD
ncbi:MAG: hypothetical protein KF724_06110 [Phycisphaeraceae bacterium]|nr:hypothetical protein [Phycisphaeraceae bacterium]